MAKPASYIMGLPMMSKVGLFVLTGSIAGYFLFPRALKSGLTGQLNLAKDGMVFPLWSKPPFLTDAFFYLYEVENPRKALSGDKIRIKRKGPYKFKVANIKLDAEFSSGNDKVSLTAARRFYFNPEGSADIDENFYTLNPVLVLAEYLAKKLVLDRLPFERAVSPILYQAVNVVLDAYKERLFHRRTPREILFGFKVLLLDDLERLASRYGLADLIPEHPPNNIFGLVYFQNVTDEPFVLHTGLGGNPEKYGDVISWRGMSNINKWKGRCNIIHGTNGELYKPFPEPDKAIKIFLAQVCRSTYIEPIGKTVTPTGVEAYEFQLSKTLFQGTRSNPDNECYCIDSRHPDCLYDGLVILGPCLFNAPAFLSRPNFDGVDPRLADTVNGLTPGEYPNKQSFYLEVNTGSIVGADLALLASFKVIRRQYMRDLGRVQETSYVPLFLAHEKITLPSDLTAPLVMLQKITNGYGTFFLLSGTAASVATIYGGYRKAKGEKGDKFESSRMKEGKSVTDTGDRNKIDDDIPLETSKSTVGIVGLEGQRNDQENSKDGTKKTSRESAATTS